MKIKKLWFALVISTLLLLTSCINTGKQATNTESATATVVKNTEVPPTPVPSSTPTLEPTPTVTPVYVDTETLNTLKSIIVPINDPNELARRLRGIKDIPDIQPPKKPLKVNDKQNFYVTSDDKNIQISATLHYITDHAYFWVDDTAKFDQGELEKIANTFEKKIYPTDRRFFGSEWTPGIDNDPHIYVLFARKLGFYLAGYFSASDEINPAVNKTSNGHEMFVMNIDNAKLNDPFTYGVLAHEFQHMIHWNLDRNETTWLNEGLSELAQFLNDYPVGGNDKKYVADPDLQLNTWTGDNDINPLHYGASFLFTTYFLDRFGKEATQSLISHPENGLESVDRVLEEMNIIDETTNKPLTADDVFLDWTIANFLNDPSIDSGKYAYQSYISPPKTRQTDIIRKCKPGDFNYDVHQYGVDYIRIYCPGDITLHFAGDVQTKIVPTDAHSGQYFLWSNGGDSSDMTMTKSFDFTGVDKPSISFWTWYDIEDGYDYVYLEASTNNGEDWKILNTPHGTDKDPVGSNFGWGYTGKTRGGEWLQETVDLSEFAGKNVLLRFEYITDASLHNQGFLIDDIAVPEINYTADFEKDNNGWELNGFTRINNILPQTFRLALITTSKDGNTVEKIPVGVNNLATIHLSLPKEGKTAILVVTGTTRFTTEKTNYTISLEIP